MMRCIGRAILPAALAFVLGTHPPAGQGLRQTRSGLSEVDGADPERTITVDGRQRSYLLHRPAGGPGKPMGLVLVFHGGTETGADAARISGLDREADRAGFVVAYPNGVDKALERWPRNDRSGQSKASTMSLSCELSCGTSRNRFRSIPAASLPQACPTAPSSPTGWGARRRTSSRRSLR